MATIRGVTHERRAGQEQRWADVEPAFRESDLSSRRAASLPVAEDPDELAPEMPPLYFALPAERDD